MSLLISLEIRSARLRLVLHKLFKETGASFTIGIYKINDAPHKFFYFLKDNSNKDEGVQGNLNRC